MNDEYYNYRFAGIQRLYGLEGADKIKNSHIMIVGLGGVGSWVVEALARTGVGELTLVDFDDICISNVNRQIHAHDQSAGQLKTQALLERVQLINKNCKVNLIEMAYSKETESEIFKDKFDVVVDCIDTSLTKVHLIAACKERNLPIVVVGSAGGRIDPTKIEVSDLSRTTVDPMMHILRKDLRRHYRFPRGKDKFGIAAIYSKEEPRFPTSDGCTTLDKPDEFLKPLDCQSGFGTATHMTGVFAFLATSETLKCLAPFQDAKS